jgi:hypothetical protein
MSGQLRAPAAILPEEERAPTAYLPGWVGQPQTGSGHSEEEKGLLPLPVIYPSIIQPVAEELYQLS